MKKVAVVILNYKVKELALKCIESVKQSSYENLQIIVVDNNSCDDIEKSLPKLKNLLFIQTGNNLGFSGGNNMGIKNALLLGAEYVFILNPDTLIQKNTITKLIEVFEEEKVGIVGPKIYFNDSKKIWFAGGVLDFNNVLGSHRGVDEIDTGKYEITEQVDYITGAAMMVKKQVFDKIGLFDEDYFLYYEDSDFCLRASRAGIKIMYVPEAIVYHYNARSTGLGSPLQDYYITRNRMLFAAKFLPFKTRFALFREGVRNLDKKVRRKAFFDFLTRNFGKGEVYG